MYKRQRHDFVEIADGFDAVLVHWGGSPQAYTSVSTNGVDELDGISYEGSYFFRDQTRNVLIEHTGYTTGEKILDLMDQKDIEIKANSQYTCLLYTSRCV